jgi:S-DNA-T family DNA segregation ATPase FtsK/SpoIIIE
VPAPDALAEPIEGTVVAAETDVQPRATVRIRAVITDVARHPRTRALARQAAYLAAGTTVTAKKLINARSTLPYQKAMNAALQQGDHETAQKWAQLINHARDSRRKYKVDRHEQWAFLLGKLPRIIVGSFFALVVLGVLMAIASHDPQQVQVPVKAVAKLVWFIAIVVTAAWLPTAIITPFVVLLALWHVGRTSGDTTGWMILNRPGEQDLGIVVTADTIVLALQHLPIPALRKAFKEGWSPTFSQPPVRDGKGYWTVPSLPLGVTPQMIADQRPVLARNVHRSEIETWPSDAEKNGTGPAGYLDLWIADPGALSKAAPEYPLLHEGKADVFAGVPGGVSPRGAALMVPIVGNNFVAGGQMGQGKSNTCRVIMLGCALDPLCVLDAFVFANNGDFDAYAPRLANYHKGVDDETAYAALERLRWLYAEVGRREQRIAELGAKKVTRGLAKANPDLRPIVSLYSECHELFDHPEVGAEAGELATKTAKRARKTAIVLGFDTQSSRKEAIPPKLVELVSVNICFYVKTWRSNDGFLGDGCFQAGIRATELRPGRDRGTSVTIGLSDAPFELLKWYFVEVDDDTGFDAATEVIARAVKNMAPGAHAGARPAIEPEQRDLLADLDEVLGAERVRLADVPALLRERWPQWAPYRQLKGTQLRRLLADAGVRVTNTDNVPRLDPADLRSALPGRTEG